MLGFAARGIVPGASWSRIELVSHGGDSGRRGDWVAAARVCVCGGGGCSTLGSSGWSLGW